MQVVVVAAFYLDGIRSIGKQVGKCPSRQINVIGFFVSMTQNDKIKSGKQSRFDLVGVVSWKGNPIGIFPRKRGRLLFQQEPLGLWCDALDSSYLARFDIGLSKVDQIDEVFATGSFDNHTAMTRRHGLIQFDTIVGMKSFPCLIVGSIQPEAFLIITVVGVVGAVGERRR